MSITLWDEDFEKFIEKEGGVKETILSHPRLRAYWIGRYIRYQERKQIAEKEPEELLGWIHQTLLENEPEEAVCEVLAVLRIRQELARSAK